MSDAHYKLRRLASKLFLASAVLGLVVELLFAGLSAAQTNVIFNNITSPCSPYSQVPPSCGYYPVFGPTGDFAVPFSDSAAAQFSSSAGGLATEARVVVVQNANGPGELSTGWFNVAIFSDVGGLPGAPVSQTATNLWAPYCCSAAIVTASFSKPVPLRGGALYWLVLTPATTNTYMAWVVGGNSPVPVAQTLSSSNPCGWCPYAPSALQFAVVGGTAALGAQVDYFGEGKADFSVWRPSNGTWFVIDGSGNSLTKQWGETGDTTVIGDYDGDGKTDFAIFRPSNGFWYIIPSSNPGSPILRQWGTQGDIPVPGDYDGDGKTDFAVFRPSNGFWYVIPSGNPTSPIIKAWGTNGDIPVRGDYDGDGKTDFAVFRPSTGTWFIIPSSNPSAPIVQQWGTQGDIPVPGDYDGDGKTDIAVWRPSNGVWYIIPSSNPSAPIVQQWGTSGDIPVPVDYDGDGKADIAVWRPSGGTWFIIPSSTPANFTVTQWGTNGDVPVQKPIGQ